MIDLSQCFGLRLGVGNPTSGQVRVGCRGLVCAGVGEKLGQPALVGLVEEEVVTRPQDALPTLEAVVKELARQWNSRVPVRSANLVMNAWERGWWHVWLVWRGESLIQADATPVNWPDVAPNSEAALEGVFGQQARRLLGVVEEMVAFDRGYFDPREKPVDEP